MNGRGLGDSRAASAEIPRVTPVCGNDRILPAHAQANERRNGGFRGCRLARRDSVEALLGDPDLRRKQNGGNVASIDLIVNVWNWMGHLSHPTVTSPEKRIYDNNQ